MLRNTSYNPSYRYTHNMRSLLLCALVPLCAGYVKTSWRDLQANAAYSFDDYLQEYGKSYSASEYIRRRAIFEANVRTIRAHNSDATQSWKMGLNEFADWKEEEVTQKRKGLSKRRMTGKLETHRTPAHFAVPDAVDWRNHSVNEEVVQKRTGLNRASAKAKGGSRVTLAMEGDVPVSMDWREKENIVTPVKNQGSCGSCWAFSATEALESAAAIATGKLQVLGPQQMVSCTENPNQCGGTGGCAGATQPLGLNYTAQAGLSLEVDYPYTAKTGTCEKSKIKPAVGNKGVAELTSNDYNSLIHAVATAGPVAVSVAANWVLYEGGVYSNAKCGYEVDHGVVVVGYGTDAAAGHDYWIVRNSWGASWGESGYIRLARFGDGKEPCGMDNEPLDGDACKGETDPIKYCGICAVLSSSAYPTGAYNL
eukprot:TRINITY_DN28_c0_g1_i10.p2 TRINITY_DN28_c0_g1~~TRINITY_DN28_c0_g1_i10.p2  ORF type:complete len:424 (+),score=154.93 TRINITY_DN28_c0_g1_i10:1087-2358(+)